jgi:quercetin 2,3-dioxygenase
LKLLAFSEKQIHRRKAITLNDTALIDVSPLGMHWPTLDPFLFCAHHDDAYPAGNEQMGPDVSLDGRAIGQDFSGNDGWSMYHGDTVPGFPQHPHRGFETVTIPRKGFVDHADSLGASARFGEGDVQWMTAGSGIVHSEMFPLRNGDQDNHAELFQIWLNLPARSKMVPSYFSMFWRHQIPELTTVDEDGLETTVVNYCGHLADDTAASPPAPPPDSWAADADNLVTIQTISMAPGAKWTLPATDAGCSRRLFFFTGDHVETCGQQVATGHAMTLEAGADIDLRNGPEASEFLLLQGLPIAEPVVQYGPFVMNTEAEIHQAIADYQSTGFGGWPWPKNDPTHPRNETRFARHPDGRLEKAND